MKADAFRTVDRWRQIEDLFHEAIRRDPEDRSAFLERACGSDLALRSEVESLLQNHTESATSVTVTPSGAADFLEDAVQSVAGSYMERHSAPAIRAGDCLDQYCVIQLLGAGGMGEVYLAEDTRLGRRVALKMLPRTLTSDPEALRRFEKEARMVSSLNHANLLMVFEFCQAQERSFLVTEYIEGETLRERMDRGRLTASESVEIALQATAGLAAAHAAGIVHRDIKPENILLRQDGCVKIVDFGIAKLTELSDPQATTASAAASELRTQAGALLGTPRYMSPEQARGSALDARTDIFSLGAVLYELLAGKAPFQGDTRSDLIADILRTDPEPLSRAACGNSKSLQAIVRRMLQKDRGARYENAIAVQSALQMAKEEISGHARRLIDWRISGAMLLGLAMLAGLLVLWQRNSGVAPHTRRHSLAVLPFRNLKPDAQTDFLGLSLADEVISKLAYVKALTVRPASAVSRYRARGEEGTLEATASALSADMLLTGTYLKDGPDLRITARLIGFKPTSVLWQDTLVLQYDKLLTVQDRVSQLIIRGLALQLGPDEQQRLKPDAPVNNLAYEYYLRGLDLYGSSNFGAAIAMFEKSAAIDPGYAPTWAHLGRAYTTNASLQFGGRNEYRRAEAAYEKAIELNPASPEPRVYMANLFTDTGRVEQSVPLLRVALKSSPNDAEAHWELGYAYRFGGMLPQSAAECEWARRLDPEVKINSSALNSYLYLGEYDRFLASLPANDSPLLLFYHGFGLFYKHDFPGAERDFERAFELAPDLLQAQVGDAIRDSIQGQTAAGIARLQETERRMQERGVSDPEAMYKLAQAYAVLGDSDRAIRMLQRSTAGGFFCYPYMIRDPLLNSLHSNSEYRAVLEQARQRSEQFQQRFAPGA